MMTRRAHTGFTLIETLVAISLLTIAIVAPMSLTTQSLTGAFYARDQVTAYFMAQEGIEAVRSYRDGNILSLALGTNVDIMSGIPIDQDFRVDTHTVPATLTSCQTDPNGVCIPVQTDGTIYGYGNGASGWHDTNFIRSLRAHYVSGTDEVTISVRVVWYTTPLRSRAFTLQDNLYRWVNSGSGSTLAGPNTIFLTSGSSWTVPANWNNTSNTIEVIGGGGGGSTAVFGSYPGMGGGGGAYAKTVNVFLTAGGTVSYQVGSGGLGATTAQNGGDTYFCNSISNCGSINGTAVIAGAKGGSGGSSFPGSGGSAASSIGTVTRSGGNGSNNNSGNGAGGGGGAAGPNGAGANAGSGGAAQYGGGGGGGDGNGAVGSNGGADGSGGNGGSSQNGTAGGLGGASPSNNGQNGSQGSGGGGSGGGQAYGQNGGIAGQGGQGSEWDATHGSGGGGGGGGAGYSQGDTSGGSGGPGGYYGGGGGGGGYYNIERGGGVPGAGGAGAPGIIVITYTP